MTSSRKRMIELTITESRLRQLLLDASTYVGTLKDGKKPSLRITGGWVRDKLLGITSHDIDIGIDNMTGLEFGTMLKQYLNQPEVQVNHPQDALGSLAKIEANPEKSKHLETVTTKIMGLDIDLVNLRKEIYSEDSRNPTMEFGTPQEDAQRRDATINALFYNLHTNEIEDFTGRGLTDLDKRVIKTPLAPLQTFKDDPLRILRCIRFATRLGYEIDPGDETAMRDGSIKAALRLKISRERVGVEITKMLNDPNAPRAIALIDQLDLYNTVFTDPTDPNCKVVKTKGWNHAYDSLLHIVHENVDTSPEYSSLRRLKSTLLRDSRDTFLAWMLACFVPWARETSKPPKKAISKKQPSPASLAAREGIKADNKMCKLVEAAAVHLQDVIDLKNSITAQHSSDGAAPERKQTSIIRQVHGQAIRAWGSEWRTIVLFALLTEAMELEDPTKTTKLLEEYANWMFALRSLDLLDIDKLVPLVKGDQLCQALGSIKSGPWLKKALCMAMDWQLRNPQERDPSGGIAEVVARRIELPISDNI